MSKFYVIGVPIGNFEDISERALRVLASSELIICEDTRESCKLLLYHGIQYYGIQHHSIQHHSIQHAGKKLISYIGSYKKAIEETKRLLQSGSDVSLICDRGMPCISDPGALIINNLISENYEITCIPGPSSITAAFALSGYVGGFVFQGFLPRKKDDILRILNYVQDYNLIFFESALRMPATLAIINSALPESHITIVKELTKKYEQITRGSPEELLKNQYIGEFVCIVKQATNKR